MYTQDSGEILPKKETVWSDIGMSSSKVTICLTKGSSTLNAYVYDRGLDKLPVRPHPVGGSRLMTADGNPDQNGHNVASQSRRSTTRVTGEKRLLPSLMVTWK